ncbi:hypothetical protein [Halorhabdus salina]|uniref:hypothetical protein n=1 Tax=Halorhabdus salina TaxID=2750670 RepID=UPI0015EE59AD|nr:hypothetical protein [Halorhabdus salina]
MSLGRRIGLGLAGVVLIVALVGSNAFITAGQTALSADYVTETLEDEDAYAEATDVLEEQISNEIGAVDFNAGGSLPAQIDASGVEPEQLVDDALTESYVRTQTNQNIEAIYAFLHGETDALLLEVDLVPVKSNFAEAVTEGMIAVDAPALADVAADQVDGAGGQIDATTVEGLLESESSFQQTRAEFQASLPDGADLNTVNEQLKSDLETATRQEIGGYDQGITDAAVDFEFATVDALTGDLTYQKYSQKVESLKKDIAERAQVIVQDRLDQELPNTLSLTENMDADARDRLDTAAGGVQLVDLLTLVLPGLALLLIGVLAVVTRSPWTVGRTAGASSLIAGITGFLPALLARDPLTSAIRDAIGGPDGQRFADVAVALVDGIFAQLRTQSLLLLVVGIVLLALVFADKRGYFDGVRQQLGFGPAPRGVGAGGSRQAAQRPRGQAGQQPPDQRGQRGGQRQAGPGQRGQGSRQGGQPGQSGQQPGPNQRGQQNHRRQTNNGQPRQPGGRQPQGQSQQGGANGPTRAGQGQPPGGSDPQDPRAGQPSASGETPPAGGAGDDSPGSEDTPGESGTLSDESTVEPDTESDQSATEPDTENDQSATEPGTESDEPAAGDDTPATKPDSESADETNDSTDDPDDRA